MRDFLTCRHLLPITFRSFGLIIWLQQVNCGATKWMLSVGSGSCTCCTLGPRYHPLCFVDLRDLPHLLHLSSYLTSSPACTQTCSPCHVCCCISWHLTSAWSYCRRLRGGIIWKKSCSVLCISLMIYLLCPCVSIPCGEAVFCSRSCENSISMVFKKKRHLCVKKKCVHTAHLPLRVIINVIEATFFLKMFLLYLKITIFFYLRKNIWWTHTHTHTFFLLHFPF